MHSIHYDHIKFAFYRVKLRFKKKNMHIIWLFNHLFSDQLIEIGIGQDIPTIYK
jgi:hypothetical protein